jgi:flagellar motor switch protein FliG
MADFKGGIKEAAKMLQGLSPERVSEVLAEIAGRDPKMAEALKQNLVQMDDLQYLTTSMLVHLLRDIDLTVFGLALRGIDQAITSKILSQVSTGIRLDIEDGLKGPPRRASEVAEAQVKVLDLVRKKIELGQIVINPLGDELV